MMSNPAIVINEIVLRRRNKLTIPERHAGFYNPDRANLVLAMAKNVESLGFAFSMDTATRLLYYSDKELEDFYKQLIPMLKKLVGADVEYHPMYPNFPQQVIDAPLIELFFNALMHYMTDGEYLPEYVKEERLPMLDACKAKILTLADENGADLMDIFSNLLRSKTSLSDQDKADVEWIVLNNVSHVKHMPEEIPLKENVAFISKLIIEKSPLRSSKCIERYFSTATDVLRLIVSLSGGDISLADKTKFRSLKRSERRMILDLLAHCGDIYEDLFRYRDEWIRVAEILHVGEYVGKPKYRGVCDYFRSLRNDKKPLLYPGYVETMIAKGDMVGAANLLMERPGEFARRLDKLIRDTDWQKDIVDMFEKVADRVAVPVLLQVRQHFLARHKNDAPVRVFFPKGSVAHAIVQPNDLKPIDRDICRRVVTICNKAIMTQFAKDKPEMGKVYVDPELKSFMVPFSQRSASSGSKIMIRGSSIPISKDAKFVRAFIWWTNMDKQIKDEDLDYWSGDPNRVDIDLSACILDEDFRYVSHVSYTNLRYGGGMAVHSGDITNGGSVNGKGVAEFLDINIEDIAKHGRYVCFQVYSFTQQPFSSMPNSRFGWMERESQNSGEIFEPRTVEMCMNVSSDSKVSIPVIFDCKEKRFVWLDMCLSIDSLASSRGNNIENNFSQVQAICYAMMHLNKPNLHDLIALNAVARGTLTDNRNEADIIFSNDTTKPIECVMVEGSEHQLEMVNREKDTPIITAFDMDYIMGNLL